MLSAATSLMQRTMCERYPDRNVRMCTLKVSHGCQRARQVPDRCLETCQMPNTGQAIFQPHEGVAPTQVQAEFLSFGTQPYTGSMPERARFTCKPASCRRRSHCRTAAVLLATYSTLRLCATAAAAVAFKASERPVPVLDRCVRLTPDCYRIYVRSVSDRHLAPLPAARSVSAGC